ncbi:maestro heat-like repeat family member 5 [Camelus ferus]|nr:maestro heat-like repeat family member 5 [Camelus ferus]
MHSEPLFHFRICSHVSESTKKQFFMKVPQDSARKDRKTHPTTILLCKSQSSQAALVPQEHKTFLEEAYNAAICFKMLRDLNGSDPLRRKSIIKKITHMAHEAPSLVLGTIHDYFVDNPEISTRHKLRLLHVLESVIEASDFMEETWETTFMQLALENMTKSTELEEAYQDAASNVLLAVCKHSWRVVAQHLESEVLTGIFPHRSLLYVMGILTSNEELFKEGEKACWEEQLARIAIKSVQFLNTDAWSKELLGALTKPNQIHQEQPPEKGIAFTVGLAAARHLDHVWAVLEQFGRSTPVKWSLHSFSPKNSEDLRWKWASSTILLAYGQMAAKAKAHILPWVDNILSRMIFYFHCSSWLLMEKEPQDTLCTSTRQQTIHIISRLCKLRPPLDLEKKSRLLTISLRSVLSLPLLEVLEKHTCLYLEPPNIQTLYKKTLEALGQMLQSFITQNPTPDELHFLLSHMYRWLASEKAHERQRAVHSCMSLLKFLSHNLYLDPKEDFKRIGQLMGMLGILCQDPDKATQCSSLEGMGHLYQLLMRQRAGEASQARASAPKPLSQAGVDEIPVWSGRDQRAALPITQEVALPKDHTSQPGSSQVIKEAMKYLTMAELTDLVWTAIDGLGSTSPFRVQAAANMLLTVIQEHGAKLETVRGWGDEEVAACEPSTNWATFGQSWMPPDAMQKVASLSRAIHLRLCSVRIPQAKENALQAITLLARSHTPEMGRPLRLCSVRIPQAKENALQAITLLARSHTPEMVAAFLDFSIPLDRGHHSPETP